jgi:hypothetical protein
MLALKLLVLVAVAFAHFFAHGQTARSLPTVYPPTPQQMAEICKGTEDLRECGRKVEQAQGKGLGEIITRNGKLLSIKLNESGAAHFVDVGAAEGGEAFSFFAYHAIADAVTLYHSKQDKLDFMVVLRNGGAGSTVPNEPIFSSTGYEFLTVDVCRKDCEQRVTLWRIRGDTIRRHAEFLVASQFNDAAAAFTPSGSVWVELTGFDEKKQRIELSPNDARWVLASAQ